ncbi:MAG: pld1 2 [Devosia sp.]|uniref:aldo/keto reductase n=1 Tax=Devosia sp. TaxID=1871048 RepID=UPI0026094E4C|nr:aldo/keto reductase [Devosia sp.]MDB5542698.1 pld1 2 [Devosia sp.]
MGSSLIPTRPIGGTGLNISRIGFGGAPIGDLKRAPTEVAARELLQAAWDAGIRYYDTAPFYGSGLSERRIGDFLRDKPRDEYVLSTKVGRLLVPDRDWAMTRHGDARAMPFRPAFDFTHDGVMKSYENSLQRLGLERIDILYLHDLGRFSQRERYDETLRQALEGGGVRALEELRSSGAVKAIGAGVNEWQIIDLLMDHARFDVFLLANRYTLLDQEVIDTLLPRVRREGVAIVDGAPLNSGILATGPVPGAQFDYAPASEAMLEKTRRIEALCLAHGTTLIRAALNFPLGNDAITAIIPGFSNAAEFADNLAGYRKAIPDALWSDLKAAGLMHADAPAPVTPILA